MDVFSIAIGFDPHPLKLGWTLAAIIATAYCGRNLYRAFKDRAWVRDHTLEPRARERRLGVVAGHITLHRFLTVATAACLVAGLGTLLTPAAPMRDDQPITLGLLVVPVMLILELVCLALLGYFYDRRRERQVQEGILMAARMREATQAQLEREAGNPPGLEIRESDGEPVTRTATLDLKLDLEIEQTRDSGPKLHPKEPSDDAA